jgi:hypothetical protein
VRKRISLIVGLPLAAVALVATLPYDNQSFAVYGCCKARKDYWEQWGKTLFNFKDCEEKNERQDGDNVFDEQGYWWWDVEC